MRRIRRAVSYGSAKGFDTAEWRSFTNG